MRRFCPEPATSRVSTASSMIASTLPTPRCRFGEGRRASGSGNRRWSAPRFERWRAARARRSRTMTSSEPPPRASSPSPSRLAPSASPQPPCSSWPPCCSVLGVTRAAAAPLHLMGSAHAMARTCNLGSLRSRLAPSSGEVVVQTQLGSRRTDSLVRVLYAQPGSCSSTAQCRAVSTWRKW
jgi:hypothetical protein